MMWWRERPFTLGGTGAAHLRVRNLSAGYGPFLVLRDVTLEARPGLTVILGPNGSGKSTLLRIMAGVDKDFGGEAFAAEGTRIGLLPQEPALDPERTVRVHVEEGVAGTRALLTRFEEISARFAEPMSDEEMDKLLAEHVVAPLSPETERAVAGVLEHAGAALC